MTLSDILTVLGIIVTILGIYFGLSMSKKSKTIVKGDFHAPKTERNSITSGTITSNGDVKIAGNNLTEIKK